LQGTTAKVLVVDDVYANRDILGSIVQALGHETVDAGDGEEALELVEQNNFDLILLDVMMPRMDGFQVLQRLRERYDVQQLPVILITAVSDVEQIVNALAVGANDYITKPFNIKIVRVRIQGQIRMKKLYDDRARLLNTMQHANDLKNRLMRIASHDLKNPVSNLHMVMQLLEPAVPVTDENQDLMNMGYRYIETMNAIIEEFLDLDVLKDQEIVFDMEPFALDEAVLSTLKDYSAAAERKGVRMVASLDQAVVNADKERMGQIVANLVSNAIKYTPPGTTVTVTGEHHSGQYTLHVIDEGSGIPQDEIHTLFQPFGKLSTQPTAGENSTGLGLWIVKQLAEAQGGTVGVYMDYTDGADFWLQMPTMDVS